MPAHFPGNVPAFEEHSARIEAHYNLFEWDRIGSEGRAYEVAHYRLRRMLEVQSALKQERDSKSAAKKGRAS